MNTKAEQPFHPFNQARVLNIMSVHINNWGEWQISPFCICLRFEHVLKSFLHTQKKILRASHMSENVCQKLYLFNPYHQSFAIKSNVANILCQVKFCMLINMRTKISNRKRPPNGKRTHFTVCMSNGNFHAPPTTKPFPLIIWKGKVWIVSCLSRIQHLCTFQLLLLNIRIAYRNSKKQ